MTTALFPTALQVLTLLNTLSMESVVLVRGAIPLLSSRVTTVPSFLKLRQKAEDRFPKTPLTDLTDVTLLLLSVTPMIVLAA